MTTENPDDETISSLDAAVIASIEEPADLSKNGKPKKSAAGERRFVKESDSASGAERRAAAAGPGRARIVEFETGAVQSLDVIERSSSDVRKRHFVNQNVDPIK